MNISRPVLGIAYSSISVALGFVGLLLISSVKAQVEVPLWQKIAGLSLCGLFYVGIVGLVISFTWWVIRVERRLTGHLKSRWRLFLFLLAIFLLALWILGLPPKLGSLYHIDLQWRHSIVIAFTTFCLLVATFWIYRRTGFTFKIQAVVLWLLIGTVFFSSAYSTYNSLMFLHFEQNMLNNYEVTCDKYISLYASSDIEGAKKALHDIINFSLAEKSKAKYYWRFNTLIGGSEARLAVIAENQGDEKEAEKLSASASDYWMLGDEAFRQECRETGEVDMRSFDANPVKRMTPDQWREFVAKLDKNVKWKSQIPH